MPVDKETARFNDLIGKWKNFRGDIAEPAKYCQLKNDLYQVRNPGYNGSPELSAWPDYLLDPDDGTMAAVEHYFLCRCWVGSGAYPAWQVRAMNVVYDVGKVVGVTPRHNPNKPTTPLTAMQLTAKEAGVRDGEADLRASGKRAPLFSAPPKYF